MPKNRLILLELLNANNPNAGESGIYYRIPVSADISISDGINQLYYGRALLPQFGVLAPLPENLLKGDHIAAIGNTPLNLDLENIWIVIPLLLGIAVFKAIAMTTTFGAGGVGGVFVPTLFMGSALGNVIAKIINNLTNKLFLRKNLNVYIYGNEINQSNIAKIINDF